MTRVPGRTSGDHVPAHSPSRPFAPRSLLVPLVMMLMGTAMTAGAQSTPGVPSGGQTTPTPPDPPLTISVTVIGTTALPGVELPAIQVPSPVQTATDRDIDQSGALELSDFLNRRMNGVYVNEVQNNPFQADVNYRGYTASPLLGTPQGLSVYMDGVRLNQPFGEVVSWDLIPRIAIASTTLMPGSNPLFGLNTLGGALSLQTKDGRKSRGTRLEATYGSDVRRSLEFEHGGRTAASRFHWYLAGTLFGEDGWRDDSPSDVRQIFGKAGWQRDRADVTVSVAHADNSLSGNGVQEYRLLDRDYGSIYTKPDITDNRSTLLNVSAQHRLRPGVSLLANAYYRDIRTNSVNGDINEESLDQALYQPDAAERAALAAAGYGAIPATGLDAGNTPFPSLRCIANALLNDEPSEKCNGLINQSRTAQQNGGATGQVTHRRALGAGENVFTVGAGFDRSSVGLTQFTELGYLNPDRSVTGVGAFGDGGLTGGEADGEPYDTRVDLDGHVTTWSVYLTDTLPIGSRAHVTLSGRYNRSSIRNRDRIEPGGGPGSLDGDHVFARFNPAAGVTFDVSRAVNVYAGYSEGSRAATSIELGCADPEEPCKLPNAMAGDPPLSQVVARTAEGGIRGTHKRLAWYAGAFRAENRDDILFVTSDQTGFGYFKNFGKTRRQGLETGARSQVGRVTFGVGYTLLDATFESEETVNGESNSTNDAARDGEPGLEGLIEIEPGDRLPFIPRHLLKIFGEVQITRRLSVDADLLASSSSYARGNENNRHEPDGTYYLGEGTADGYAIVNLGARYALTSRLEVIGQVNNLFNRNYATGAQLGPTGFTESGTFVARPLPAIGGEFPVRQSTFLAAGAPIRAWVGARVRF
jgi:outer membrane receptor protein involved in Fe transport